MASSLVSKVCAGRLVSWSMVTRRTLSASSVLTAKTQAARDPVKQLFMDKVKEYTAAKSKGGKPPGLTKEDEEQLAAELTRLKNIYGEGSDLSQFPTFDFKNDPKIDWK